MLWTELNWTELNWSRPLVLRYLTVYCVVLPRLYLQYLTVLVPHFISRLGSSIISLWMEMSLWDSWVEEERERDRERLGVQTERFRDIGVTIDDDLLPIDYDIVLSKSMSFSWIYCHLSITYGFAHKSHNQHTNFNSLIQNSLPDSLLCLYYCGITGE
jgi:hypothetical protein